MPENCGENATLFQKQNAFFIYKEPVYVWARESIREIKETVVDVPTNGCNKLLKIKQYQ